MLGDAEFRHGFLDPTVAKRRVRTGTGGVYVEVAALVAALRERDYAFTEDELDRYVTRIGGHRVQHGKWIARIVPLGVVPRPAQYFLPALASRWIRDETSRRARDSRRL